jgi:hypothetical protein
MGEDYAYISLVSKEDGTYISFAKVKESYKGTAENEQIIDKLKGDEVHFRVEVQNGGRCRFSYSENGRRYKRLNESFTAVPGRWIGAKIGLFATRSEKINDSGYADYDWFRITPLD